MQTLRRAARLALPVFFLARPAAATAQDLVPGAYTPAPVGFNVLNFSGAFSVGGVSFDPTLPVEDVRARLGIGGMAYARTLGLGGRFANLTVGVPYVYGHLEGLLAGQHEERWLSGFGDPVVRFAVNFVGAPAMTPKEFAAYRARTIVAASVTVGIPIGTYDPTRVINLGRNRWSFKPEIGISQTRGRWTVEGDFAASVFTENDEFVGGVQSQAPIYSAQGHLIYTIRFGYWIAADANFWGGGRLTVNGARAVEQMGNSRAGITLALPIFKRQIRIAYSFGAFTRLGGDFHTVGVSYSHAWK